MVFEVYIKVWHPSPYSTLSSKLGGSELLSFCNDYYDLMVLQGKVTEETLNILKSSLPISGDISYNDSKEHNFSYIITECVCETSAPEVYQHILKNRGIQIAPVKYSEGWEYHKFVSLTKNDVAKVLKSLKEHFEFEIISIREDSYYGPMQSYGITAFDVMMNLTEGQSDLLTEAYNRGYYQIPRSVKLADIAEEIGITRYAVERRLRSAENSIMDLIVPFINFRYPQIDKKYIDTEIYGST